MTEKAKIDIVHPMEERLEGIRHNIHRQMVSRAYRGAIVLQNNAKLVLRGQRNGRRYKVPGTFRRQRDKVSGKMKRGRYYSASMPGEPPAVRTGVFRLSWLPGAVVVHTAEKGGRVYTSSIASSVKAAGSERLLGDVLEEGTAHMEPRPYQGAIREQAARKIKRIYEEPYF